MENLSTDLFLYFFSAFAGSKNASIIPAANKYVQVCLCPNPVSHYYKICSMFENFKLMVLFVCSDSRTGLASNFDWMGSSKCQVVLMPSFLRADSYCLHEQLSIL